MSRVRAHAKGEEPGQVKAVRCVLLGYRPNQSAFILKPIGHPNYAKAIVARNVKFEDDVFPYRTDPVPTVAADVPMDFKVASNPRPKEPSADEDYSDMPELTYQSDSDDDEPEEVRPHADEETEPEPMIRFR